MIMAGFATLLQVVSHWLRHPRSEWSTEDIGVCEVLGSIPGSDVISLLILMVRLVTGLRIGGCVITTAVIGI